MSFPRIVIVERICLVTATVVVVIKEVYILLIIGLVGRIKGRGGMAVAVTVEVVACTKEEVVAKEVAAFFHICFGVIGYR